MQILLALEGQPCVFQVSLSLLHLRFGGGEIGFGLRDLIAGHGHLIVEFRFGLRHLRSGLLFAFGVEIQVGPPLPGLDLTQQIVALNGVAFLYQKRLQAALNLRTNNNLIGGYDTGQDDLLPSPRDGVIDGGGGQGENQNQDWNSVSHAERACGPTNGRC